MYVQTYVRTTHDKGARDDPNCTDATAHTRYCTAYTKHCPFDKYIQFHGETVGHTRALLHHSCVPCKQTVGLARRGPVGTKRGSQSMRGTGQQVKYCLNEGGIRYNKGNVCSRYSSCNAKVYITFCYHGQGEDDEEVGQIDSGETTCGQNGEGVQEIPAQMRVVVVRGMVYLHPTHTIELRTCVGPEQCNVHLRNKISQFVYANLILPELCTQCVCNGALSVCMTMRLTYKEVAKSGTDLSS